MPAALLTAARFAVPMLSSVLGGVLSPQSSASPAQAPNQAATSGIQF